jgi:hypothetical protein
LNRHISFFQKETMVSTTSFNTSPTTSLSTDTSSITPGVATVKKRRSRDGEKTKPERVKKIKAERVKKERKTERRVRRNDDGGGGGGGRGRRGTLGQSVTKDITKDVTATVVVGEKKVEERAENGISDREWPRIFIRITHQGWWITRGGRHVATDDHLCDRNSVILDRACLLYIYKLALRHLLLARGRLHPRDVDPQNLVPHILARDPKSTSRSHDLYDELQGATYLLTRDMVSDDGKMLILELDADADLHCTMVFKRPPKAKSKSKTKAPAFDYTAALIQVILDLDAHPERIAEYAALEYFGQDEISYWAEPGSYPLHITKPKDWVAPKRPSTAQSALPPNHFVSAAGIIRPIIYPVGYDVTLPHLSTSSSSSSSSSTSLASSSDNPPPTPQSSVSTPLLLSTSTLSSLTSALSLGV